MSDSHGQESRKQLAGRHAAGFVEPGMKVGLGTGSTVRHTILALAEQRIDIVCVATSEQTYALATEHGLQVRTPDELGALDIAIDGADEVDEAFNVVKGGGGALTREKIVASMASRFLIVVDESKLVPKLGAFGLPLEALPFAPGVVAERVKALGAHEVIPRPRPSDNGCVLLDAAFGTIADPGDLARRLSDIPGLVEHGLFLADMVERVIVAGSDGVSERVRAP